MSQQYYNYREWRFGGTDAITWAVQRLILANAFIFAVQLVIDIPLGSMWSVGAGGVPGGLLVQWLSFEPVAFSHGALWQPFTYMFLHAGLLHLFLNLLWLFFFGPEVERVLGTRQFMRFFLLCGALGVLATYVRVGLSFLMPAVVAPGDISVVGASGAVMGVMVAYAIINPTRQFFLLPLPIPINARALVVIIIIMNLFALNGGDTSVATHFGGMAVGFAYMKLVPLARNWPRIFRGIWKKRNPRPDKTGDGHDNVGEAIDNIFRFEDKKKWR